MTHLCDLTLEQMRAMTGNQILDSVRTWIGSNYPVKRDLIRFLLGIEKEQKEDELTYWEDGQVKRARVTYYDLETGARTGRLIINWDYYNNGSIQDITFSVRDADNVEIQRYRIVHPRNGQPYMVILET